MIGSIADHSAALAVDEVKTYMAQVVHTILAAELPAHRSSPGQLPRVTEWAGTYEFVLNESMRMFHQRGYRVTGIEDIAAAVGMQPSGIYRYFRSKADILVAACWRAADRLSGDLAEITSQTTDSERALAGLVAAHVSRFFGNPAGAYLLYTEGRNLPAAEYQLVDCIQQSTVEAWACLVNRSRPETSIPRARYAVYAAFGLPVSIGQWDDSIVGAVPPASLRRLMEVTLLGRPAKPAG